MMDKGSEGGRCILNASNWLKSYAKCQIVNITHYTSTQVEFTLFEDSLTSVDLTLLALQNIISLYMKSKSVKLHFFCLQDISKSCSIQFLFVFFAKLWKN